MSHTTAPVSICDSIATLAMVYLDGELAAEEKHELETHVVECAACRAEIDHALVEQDARRAALATPRAPAAMRNRIVAALDNAERAETKDIQRAKWRQLSSGLLPGAAILAAAAALAVFVGSRQFGQTGQVGQVATLVSGDGASTRVGAIARAGLHQQIRALPLEVGGPTFGPNFAKELSQVEGSRLLGHRILPQGVNGHDATLYAYDVPITDDRHHIARRIVVTLLVIEDISPSQMSDGQAVQAAGRLLHVVQIDGHTAVTAVDASQRGYMFMAEELAPQELVALVGRTSLVGQQ